jgi:hypothetical protein
MYLPLPITHSFQTNTRKSSRIHGKNKAIQKKISGYTKPAYSD